MGVQHCLVEPPGGQGQEESANGRRQVLLNPKSDFHHFAPRLSIKISLEPMILILKICAWWALSSIAF